MKRIEVFSLQLILASSFITPMLQWQRLLGIIIFYDIGYPLINSGQVIKFPFKPGMLLIFPGFIPHEVPPNKTNNRLIISGNAI